jgi:ArsR family transcriptional regulator
MVAAGPEKSGKTPHSVETAADNGLRQRRHRVFSSRLTAMDNKQIERISKALADQTRLRIFEAISTRCDMTCGELVSLRSVTPATISHHLKILLDAGLIECRKDGQFVHSRVVPETIAEYSAALARIASRGKVARKSAKN